MKIAKKEKDVWEDFLKEATYFFQEKELLDDFIERMKDAGFSVSYEKVNARKDKEFFLDIIKFFNQVTGSNYLIKYPSPISDTILNRKKEGFSSDIMKQVVLMLKRRWRNTEMEINLRPDIVFDRTKFHNYVGQLPSIPVKAPIITKSAPPPILFPEELKRETAAKNVDAMQTFLALMCGFDSQKQDIALHGLMIDEVYQFLKKTGKYDELQKKELQEKALNFADEQLKAHNKGKKEPVNPETKEGRFRIRVAARYYFVKSLLIGKTLEEVKSWVKIEYYLKDK